MPTEHVAITDAERHEPKGASTALSKQVYVSDGAASGTWTFKQYVLNARIPDISSAGSVWVPIPIGGKITKIYSAIDGAITLADAVLSFEIATVLVTSGNITIANVGSGAGVVDSSTPSAANTVVAGGTLEIITNGASTGVVPAEISVLIDIQ